MCIFASVYVTKNLALLTPPNPCPLPPPLRATPDGLINRAQAHLFTHHAHHHPSLTICTPQPTERKKVRQQQLAPAGLQQHNLMEHHDPSFLSTPPAPLLFYLQHLLLIAAFPLHWPFEAPLSPSIFLLHPDFFGSTVLMQLKPTALLLYEPLA